MLWLWRRPVATAPIRPLAWEPSYAPGAALEKAKKKPKIKKKRMFLITNVILYELIVLVGQASVDFRRVDSQF